MVKVITWCLIYQLPFMHSLIVIMLFFPRKGSFTQSKDKVTEGQYCTVAGTYWPCVLKLLPDPKFHRQSTIAQYVWQRKRVCISFSRFCNWKLYSRTLSCPYVQKDALVLYYGQSIEMLSGSGSWQLRIVCRYPGLDFDLVQTIVKI